ncbi:MAG: transglycosylase SLT domain-containing protein [Bacteroidetes bacterium]|nr:transglycosylase SLT domain-containing protein [Bacteroidota bacterium]
MRKIFTILLFIPVLLKAQHETKDSIVVAQAPVADSVIVRDTVKTEWVVMPSNLEFIPADETPELIADRLSCLQQEIPLDYNGKIQGFIDYFLVRDREYVRMVLRKKDLYFPLFEKKLKEHNLPEELKYLSIIESGLNPRATSRARAVGLWQFMSYTGRTFGLRHDWFTDDRQDPEKATEAACLYLEQLYSLFHNWHLALAAYNSGPGTVQRAIRRSGHKKTFWEIYNFLPRETRSYVPQYIAIIYAVNYAADHNIHEIAREQVIPNDTLSVNQFFHFDTFAHLTNTCAEDLQNLNPGIKKNAIPDDGKVRTIKIPLIAKENLIQKRKTVLDSTASKKKEWEAIAKAMSNGTYGRDQDVYYVRYGDALSTIAHRFGVSVRHLREWNNLNGNLIRTGQRLIIWMEPRIEKGEPPLKPTVTSSSIPAADSHTDGIR